ncbi:YxeA family protein [Leuconostocaceae bacterium ESL0958]|nr:YxeA family protein [Leuconostocaceae bacterium ESL0958]
MKKKSIWAVIAVLTCFLLGGLFIQGKHYYENTYDADTAYAKVPAQVPKKQEARDDSGKLIKGTYSYDYELRFVTKDGEVRQLKFSQLGDEQVKPLTPNSYVKADVSKKRVVAGPNPVTTDQISAKVKVRLDDAS